MVCLRAVFAEAIVVIVMRWHFLGYRLQIPEYHGECRDFVKQKEI